MSDQSAAIDTLRSQYEEGHLSKEEYEQALSSLGATAETDEPTDSDTPADYSPNELLALSDEEAADLPEGQQQRRAKLQELYDDAEQTKEQWAEEDRRVSNVVINADPEALGTRVNLFGNDLLVQINTDNPNLREAAKNLQEYEDSEQEMEDLSSDDREELATAARDLLDALLIQWNGTEWDRLPETQRHNILADARESWGFENFVISTVRCVAAAQQQFDETAEMVDSFRGAERGESRAATGDDGLPDNQ